MTALAMVFKAFCMRLGGRIREAVFREERVYTCELPYPRQASVKYDDNEVRVRVDSAEFGLPTSGREKVSIRWNFVTPQSVNGEATIRLKNGEITTYGGVVGPVSSIRLTTFGMEETRIELEYGF